MDGQLERANAHARTLPPTNVRVLTSDEELAEAVARAEDGAKRLHDRLAARAARDAWMAEHPEQRVGWRRFVHGETTGPPPLLTPVTAPTARGAASRSPAA